MTTRRSLRRSFSMTVACLGFKRSRRGAAENGVVGVDHGPIISGVSSSGCFHRSEPKDEP